jgi:hypothetical protein
MGGLAGWGSLPHGGSTDNRFPVNPSKRELNFPIYPIRMQRGREEGKKLTWRDGVQALWILVWVRLR